MTVTPDSTVDARDAVAGEPINSITHPIINSPYEQPSRYWKLDHEHRATSEQVAGRRPSANLPAVPTQRLGEQLPLIQNQLVNEIRDAVGSWRDGGYEGATVNTRRLLAHWTNPLAMRRLFFAQVEALETLIWLTEVAPGSSGRPKSDLLARAEQISRDFNDNLLRMAVKMATGTGKTATMGMVIAWHAVNAASGRRNGRHAGRYHTQFLAITPGLTVRERLGVLDPTKANNVYAELDLVPADLRKHLGRVQVRQVNFQAFQRRDILGQHVTGDTRRLLRQSAERVLESPRAMLVRVLRGMRALAGDGKIVVLNDEAHHCYLPGSERGGGAEPLAAVAKKQQDEPAALWFNALRSLRTAELLAEPVYDFSATPMFISTAARKDAEMFPWCVSDFSLLDAIESGLVKIPRVPVEDDSDAESPVWRRLFQNTNPKKLQRGGLHGAISSGLEALYRNYESIYEQWCGESAERPMPTPPVFIVVAGDIVNAEALHDYIAGYTEEDGDGHPVYHRGACSLFSNVTPDRSGWEPSIRTLLVHSQLEQETEIGRGTRLGRAISAQASLLREMGGIGPGMDDQSVVREALNTVGKAGKLGEQIRCVVSVSMLTEGWDAKCTHILGYRAFSTQLLCEQVVGRALRRSSYDVGDDGLLPPEFAEVLGVPFDFLPPASRDVAPNPEPRQSYEIKTLTGRQDRRIDFPLIASYRFAEGSGSRRLDPGRVAPFKLAGTPTMAVMVGVAGTEEIVASAPDDARRQQVEAEIASALVQAWERELLEGGESARRVFLFRNAIADVRQWLELPQVRAAAEGGAAWRRLLSSEARQKAVDAMVDACVPSEGMKDGIVGVYEHPRLRSTHGITYQTSLSDHYPYSLDAQTECSEINIAACHSGPEAEIARLLDAHRAVTAWARNYGLGWTVPYLHDGAWRRYEPDFVARLFGGRDTGDAVYLMIEGKREPDDKSAAKREYVERYWIPAVRNDPNLTPSLRRWAFTQIPESYEAYEADSRLLAVDLNAAIHRARQLLPAAKGVR